MCNLSFSFFFYLPFTIAFAQLPSVIQKLYTHIRVFHPSGFTRTCICQRTSRILALGIRSPALFPSPLALLFFLASSNVLYPLTLSSSFIRSSPRLAPLRHCFARTPDGHASVYVSMLSLLYTFFASLFFSCFFLSFLLYEDVFPASNVRRASQRITFMGFPEIKRIPCRGSVAGKFRRKTSVANHLESWRRKICFGFLFLMRHWLLMVIHITF